MLNDFFIAALKKTLNAYLALDPESTQRLATLAGKAISIEFLPFHFTFQLIFQATNVDVKTGTTVETDTTIRGTPLQLANVMLTPDNRQHFFADDVVVAGNAEFGQQVIALFDGMEIDWEEHMARMIGDIPAYHTSQFLQKIGSWLSGAEKSFSSNVNEYVHEEAAWLPARAALEDFFQEIDTLRMDVDRVEVKLQQLRDSIIHDGASK